MFSVAPVVVTVVAYHSLLMLLFIVACVVRRCLMLVYADIGCVGLLIPAVVERWWALSSFVVTVGV